MGHTHRCQLALKKKKRVPVLSLASWKPVRIRRSGRAGIRGVTVAYRLALQPSLSSVHEVFHVSMLRKYTSYPTHVVDWGEITVDTYETFEEEPVRIMDSLDQVLRRKTESLVKVLWQHRGVEEATWEPEDTIRATYPFLF